MAYVILCVRFVCFVHSLIGVYPDWKELFDPDAPPQTQHTIRVDG
jgi:hypothetical protein